jgi:hypothetical protein
VRHVAHPDLSPSEVLARQLVEVGDRLCREFAVAGGPDAEAVRRRVREARAAFGSPRVTAYLPVLIERQVRHELAAARQARRDDHPG